MNAVVNEHSATALAQFQTRPSHALLLSGPTGTGKRLIAEQLATEILGIASLEAYPYKAIITPQTSSTAGISIEDVRSIEHLLSLRVPSDKTISRIVLIEDAHLLTQEAQNALLKTLEEPPQATLIILAATHGEALLPTIRSRVQHIAIVPPRYEQLSAYFQSMSYDEAAIKKAYSMTGGLPGLMSALLADGEHPLRAATDTARALLGESSFERLLRVEPLSKDKPLALHTLFIMQQMAHVSLKNAEGDAATRWQRVLTAAYDATSQLQQNANQKLVLTKLMLSL